MECCIIKKIQSLVNRLVAAWGILTSSYYIICTKKKIYSRLPLEGNSQEAVKECLHNITEVLGAEDKK